MKKIITILLLGFLFNPTWSNENSTTQPQPSSDRSFAVVLGFLPLASSFYQTPEPMKGVFFTAVDLALLSGIWHSQFSAQQKSGSSKVYFGLLVLNNLLDAYAGFKSFDNHEVKPRIAYSTDSGPVFLLDLHF